MAQPVNPTVHTAALAALEAMLNRALSLAPEGAEALAALDGTVFHFACTSPALDVYLAPTTGRIRLMALSRTAL